MRILVSLTQVAVTLLCVVQPLSSAQAGQSSVPCSKRCGAIAFDLFRVQMDIGKAGALGGKLLGCVMGIRLVKTLTQRRFCGSRKVQWVSMESLLRCLRETY